MARIEVLPGIQWNALAVFEDAKQNCVVDQPAVAIWIDDTGIKWSRSGMDKDVNWMLSRVMHRLHNE